MSLGILRTWRKLCCYVGLWHSFEEARMLFWKVLKQTWGGGDETRDAFNLVGFIRKAAQSWLFQQLTPVAGPKAALPSSVSVQTSPSPTPQHPPFPLPPNPGLTMAARQPSPCRPPAVSVSRPQDTCPSSSPAPVRPVPILTQREHKGVWGQLEVRMELARSDDLINLGDEMEVTRLSLSDGEV